MNHSAVYHTSRLVVVLVGGRVSFESLSSSHSLGYQTRKHTQPSFDPKFVSSLSERDLFELGEQGIRDEEEVHREEDEADALGQLEAAESGGEIHGYQGAEEDER